MILFRKLETMYSELEAMLERNEWDDGIMTLMQEIEEGNYNMEYYTKEFNYLHETRK
jgi:hypothetical protein